MSNIKKHLCPSCGGNLTVDNDKQMYYCKSCGSTYDYEYFREDEMHEMGETYLFRGEYIAAIDAYKFILVKDPHDFLALRGLMLAAAHLSNINELIHAETKDFSYDTELVSEVMESASAEDKKYFDDLKQIYSDMKNISDCQEKIESLRNDKRSIEGSIDMKRQYRSELFPDNELIASPKAEFIAAWIFSGVFFLFSILIFFIFGGFSVFLDAGDRNTTLAIMAFFGGIGIIAAIANMLFIFPKLRRIDEINRTIGEYYTESGRIDDKIRNLKIEEDKLSTVISRARYDFVQKDRQYLKTEH